MCTCRETEQQMRDEDVEPATGIAVVYCDDGHGERVIA